MPIRTKIIHKTLKIWGQTAIWQPCCVYLTALIVRHFKRFLHSTRRPPKRWYGRKTCKVSCFYNTITDGSLLCPIPAPLTHPASVNFPVVSTLCIQILSDHWCYHRFLSTLYEYNPPHQPRPRRFCCNFLYIRHIYLDHYAT